MATDTKNWVGVVLSGGRYEVTGLLGAGGMGFVYRALDRNLACEVVIKAPRPEVAGDAEFAARFGREIRSLVQLSHPHVVKILDVGSHQGLPFAVMQFLSGGSLRDRARQRGGTLPAGYLKDWLPQVAAALDFVHRQRYVHRDVKPDNILFDAAGNAYLGDFGVVKVLADEAERKKTLLTGLGTVLGTPQYMAPEMLLGKRFDGRIDQYALAVAVYEVLAGRYPFNGASAADVFEAQVKQTPKPLHELAAVSPALAAAVQRALAKEPDRRFADCASFAEAVLRGVTAIAAPETLRRQAPGLAPAETAALVIACPKCGKKLQVPTPGKQVQCPFCRTTFRTAGPAAPAAETPSRTALQTKPSQPRTAVAPGGMESPSTRTAPVPRKPSRRRRSRVPLLLAGLLGIAVLLGLAVSGSGLLRLGTEPPPQASADSPPGNDGRAVPPPQHDPWKPPERVREPAQDKKPDPEKPPAPVVPMPQENPKPEEKPEPPDVPQGPVKLVQASSGKVLTAPDTPGFSAATLQANDDKDEAQQWQLVADGGHFKVVSRKNRGVLDVALKSRDEGAEIFVFFDNPVDNDHQRWSWDGAGPERRLVSKLSGLVLDVSERGKAVQKKADPAARSQLWKVVEVKLVAARPAPEEKPPAPPPADQGGEVRRFREHTQQVGAAAYSPDGRLVVSGDVRWFGPEGPLKDAGPAQVLLWDAATGDVRQRFPAPVTGVLSLAFAPDGSQILAGCRDGSIRLWDAKTAKEVMRFAGHKGGVISVCFSPGGKYILSGGGDFQARIWAAATGTELRCLNGHGSAVEGVAWSPDGRLVATASWDKTVRLWDVRGGVQIRRFEAANSDLPRCVAFSPDGHRLLAGYGSKLAAGKWVPGDDQGLRLWDADKGTELLHLRLDGHIVRSAAFSPDGTRALSGDQDGGLSLWDLGAGKLLLRDTTHGAGTWVSAVAFAPDGNRALSAGSDQTVRLWHWPNMGKAVADRPRPALEDVEIPEGLLEAHKEMVFAVAVSPDGKYLLSGGGGVLKDNKYQPGKENLAILWDLKTEKPKFRLEGHTDSVRAVAFAPNGKRAATAGEDQKICLWDVETGRKVSTWTTAGGQRPGSVHALAFSPDGRSLVSGGAALTLWNVATGKGDRFERQPGFISGVAFARDGQLVLSGAGDGTTRLWNTATGKELRQIPQGNGSVEAVAWSHDGRSVATGLAGAREEDAARLWGVVVAAAGNSVATSVTLLRHLQGHTAGADAVAFSPDDKLLATGSMDGTVRVWDATWGKEVARYKHTLGVRGVAFFPDGKRLVACDDDGKVRIWPLPAALVGP
jgi:WD40 repeat protein